MLREEQDLAEDINVGASTSTANIETETMVMPVVSYFINIFNLLKCGYGLPKTLTIFYSILLLLSYQGKVCKVKCIIQRCIRAGYISHSLSDCFTYGFTDHAIS